MPAQQTSLNKFIRMNDFNEMFRNAVAIKSHEMNSKRKLFESKPLFIKAGLYYSNQLQDQRALDFTERMKLAIQLKDRGNDFFKDGQYQQAQHEYEKSLSIFLYVRDRNPNWKNEGILDEDLTYCDDAGGNEDILDLRIKVLNNLAICYIKQKMYADSIAACDLVLTYHKSAKAYYRRAKARLENINAGENDYSLAIEDLEEALNIEDDSLIRRELSKARFELRKMLKLDQSLSKQVIQNLSTASSESKTDEDEESEATDSSGSEEEDYEYSEDWKKHGFATLSYEPSYQEDRTIPVPEEITEFGKFIETRGVQLLMLYEKQKKEEEAEKYREQLSLMMQAKEKLQRISRSDFNKPIVNDRAQKFGIDLFDQGVKEEFKRLLNQNLKDLKKWLKQQQWKMKRQRILKKVKKLAEKSTPQLEEGNGSKLDLVILVLCGILIIVSVYYNVA